MLSFAYGNMGMTPLELAQFTPFELNLAYEGYVKKQDAEEMYFRKMTWYLLTPHLPKDSKFSMQQLWPTHYDKRESDIETKFTKQAVHDKLQAWKDSKNKTIN